MQILVVDDDPFLREFLAAELTSEGHEVLEAVDGQEAWTLLQSHPIQVVISDWVMPNLDGTELIREIRKASFRRYIYTILLTARNRQEDILAGLEAGADDYLTKPFDVQELQARVAIGERILGLENKLRRTLRRVRRLATHDTLTGLPNRRAVMRRARVELSRAERTAQPLSLILLDIDHFKEVNDRYGHLQGDTTLRAVAQLIKANIRPYDTVGRWGGEEFLIILPQTTLEQATDIAERLRTQISSTPISLEEGESLSLSVSLGATQADSHLDGSVERLLGRADAALYRAKSTGRDRVCVIG